MPEGATGISHAALRALAAPNDSLRLSVYLPLFTAGHEKSHNPTRWKSQLQSVEREFRALDVSKALRERCLQHAAEAVDVDALRASPGPGLAVLADADEVHAFELPCEVPPRAVVAERFHLKPLFAALDDEQPFALLEVSEGAVRYFEGDSSELAPVELPGLPTNLVDALGPQQREKNLQHHTGDPGARHDFHGHGGAKNSIGEDLARYVRQIDRVVRDRQEERPLPLLLSGVEELFGVYARTTRNPHLVPCNLPRSHKHESRDQLHARAWAALQDHRKDRARARDRVGTAVAREEGLTELSASLLAARRGRIAELFVAEDVQVWGRAGDLDEEHPSLQISGSLQRRAGDEDLLDTVAAESLRTGATVHVAPHEHVPGSGILASALRY